MVFKNILGVLFILAGIAMLVLPGQGVLTILIGISFIDFPGKRKLEIEIIQKEPVQKAVNWIREKAGKEPPDSHEATANVVHKSTSFTDHGPP